MMTPIQHFEDAAGDAEAALDRLVGIGVGAERDGTWPVPAPGELPFEQFGRILLVEQPGLEIEAGRKVQPRVARAGVAVDAPVLAAPVGVDGLIEIDVR